MDQPSNNHGKPLRDLLQVEYHILCQYVALAEQENNALAESDPDTITDLVGQKQFMLLELTRARSATKQELGEPISAAKLDLFELIVAKAREAIEINRITARLVAHQTLRLEQRRTALSGSTIDTAGGYSMTGFKDSSSGHGSIGHA
jgi:hypothetical protein